MATQEIPPQTDGTRTQAFKAACAGHASKFLSIVPKLLHRPAKRLAQGASVLGGTDDLIQEASVRALRRSEPWKSKDHMMHWFRAVLYTVRVDIFRRERLVAGGPKMVPLVDAEAWLEHKRECSPDETLAISEALEHLQANLPTAYQVFNLRFQGFSQREVASALGITEYAVQGLEKNGLKFLQRRLG